MNKLDDILCIIPARGGSKGIAGKNLMLIRGMSLVEHSVVHALNAGVKPGKIVVTSDSDDILDVAKLRDVVAHKRPSEISGDNSSTEEALLEVLTYHNCEHVLLLQPTSPIRFKDMLTNFIDFYLENLYDSALTTTKFHDFFWREDENGLDYESSYDPGNRPMRQAMQPYDFVHMDNGNACLTKTSILKKYNSRLGGEVGVFSITELEGMQIDTPEELQIFRDIYHEELAIRCGVNYG